MDQDVGSLKHRRCSKLDGGFREFLIKHTIGRQQQTLRFLLTLMATRIVSQHRESVPALGDKRVWKSEKLEDPGAKMVRD